MDVKISNVFHVWLTPLVIRKGLAPAEILIACTKRLIQFFSISKTGGMFRGGAKKKFVMQMYYIVFKMYSHASILYITLGTIFFF